MGSNTTENFRLYPRGFLGGKINPQVERTTNQFSDRSKILRYTVNEHNGSNNSIAANPHVESLYADYIKNSINTSSPDFRKSILEVALEAFGTKNFMHWYMAQFDSPAAGDMHNRFMTDTLKFISTGVRDMSLENWDALLKITDEGNSIGTITDDAKKFFGISNGYGVNTQDNSLVNIIQQWCSKAGGLEDLLLSLHILFGNNNA